MPHGDSGACRDSTISRDGTIADAQVNRSTIVGADGWENLVDFAGDNSDSALFIVAITGTSA